MESPWWLGLAVGRVLKRKRTSGRPPGKRPRTETKNAPVWPTMSQATKFSSPRCKYVGRRLCCRMGEIHKAARWVMQTLWATLSQVMGWGSARALPSSDNLKAARKRCSLYLGMHTWLVEPFKYKMVSFPTITSQKCINFLISSEHTYDIDIRCKEAKGKDVCWLYSQFEFLETTLKERYYLVSMQMGGHSG